MRIQWKKWSKCFSAICLCLCLCLAMFPLQAFAQETSDAGGEQTNSVNVIYPDEKTENEENASSPASPNQAAKAAADKKEEVVEDNDPSPVPVEQPKPDPIPDEKTPVLPGDENVVQNPETPGEESGVSTGVEITDGKGENSGSFSADLEKIKDEAIKDLDQELDQKRDPNLKKREDGVFESVNNGTPVVDASGKTTTTNITDTWKKQEVENGYEVTEVNTQEVTEEYTVNDLPGKPESDPAKGVTVTETADGYQVVTVTKRADGVEVTETRTVTNGKITVVTKTVTTTVKTYTISVSGEDGSVSLKVNGIEEVKTPQENEGGAHGKLETSGLTPDIGGGKVYQITTQSGLNVRKDPSTDADKITTLLKGECVVVYEEKDGWGRIGDGQWISLNGSYSDKGEFYRVTADSLNVRKGAGTANKIVGEKQKGDIVCVTKTKTVKGTLWGQIGDDQWISLGHANEVGPIIPEDGKTNLVTDLYGIEDKVETVPNGSILNPSIAGELYKVKSDQAIWGWQNGKVEKVINHFNEAGLVYVSEIIEVGGKKYGVVGGAKYSTAVIPLEQLEKLTAEEGQHLFYGEYGLSSAVMVDLQDGKGPYNVHQIVVKDDQGKDHYVYCADLSVRPQKDQEYTMTNVEDADYMDDHQKEMIGAIAQNGYWGTSAGTGSMDAFKGWLKKIGFAEENDKLDWITEGIAMTATQAAIWYYGNSNVENGLKLTENPFTQYMLDGKNVGYNDEKMAGKGQTGKYTQRIYDYLTNQEKCTEILAAGGNQATKLLNKDSVASASVTVTKTTKDEAGNLQSEADISFVLDVDPATITKDMQIKVVGSDGKTYGSFSLAGTGKASGQISGDNRTYTVHVNGLPGNVNLTLKLSGTQQLTKGAYLISAQGGHEKSQTFISIEEGERSYNLAVSLNMEVQQATATVKTETAASAEKTQEIDRKWNWTEDFKRSEKKPELPPQNRPDDPDDEDDPEPSRPTVVIPDPDVPRSPSPTPPSNLVTIVDPSTPLADLPTNNLVTIMDPLMPLGNLPITGGYGMALVIAGAMLLGVAILRKK